MQLWATRTPETGTIEAQAERAERTDNWWSRPGRTKSEIVI